MAEPNNKSDNDNKSVENSTNQQQEGQENENEKQRNEEIEKLRSAMMRSDFLSQKQKHKFWNTQPVPQTEKEKVQDIGPIENKTLEDVRKEPLPLPKGYEWTELDIMNDDTAEKIYTLLEGHYVEDSDAMFRFAYPIEFLRWALTPPGFLQNWHIGVQTSESHKLVAFISAVPATISAFNDSRKMVEINFLCVNKQLRSKRLAPVLIKEITRRVNLQNIWQAIYTAGVVLPTPITSSTYWHRSLNPPKLVSVNFSSIPQRFRRFQKPMEQLKRYYKLPDKPTVSGIRELKKEDVPQVRDLVQKYLDQFKIHLEFSEEDFAHWLLPREGVIRSYVVENNNHKITDFFSFYILPSSIIGNPKYKVLNAAYSFYNVATSMPFETLIQNALIKAKQLDMDVFNALDLMENKQIFENLKFGIGDGSLHYYLFNYKMPSIEPQDIGIVML
eukprot:gb/GECH01003546.1/.p1 GENE.gb/GECH01003546.1/~~gb/GECH01003546.1/.p1  ORF type:complete len:444 (+),score=121.89 gb/GECH01003546.1/:1-1332(+)